MTMITTTTTTTTMVVVVATPTATRARRASSSRAASSLSSSRRVAARFGGVSGKVRARAVSTKAVEDDDSDDGRAYVKPVQKESALLESEAFSTALTGAFVVFLLAGAFFVFAELARPVVDVMVQSFPGAK